MIYAIINDILILIYDPSIYAKVTKIFDISSIVSKNVEKHIILDVLKLKIAKVVLFVPGNLKETLLVGKPLPLIDTTIRR